MPVIAFIIFLQSSAPLAGQFAEIAKTSGGRVGVFSELLETGETAGLNDTERFPMQSVYKLPIAMAGLDQVDRQTLTLNQKGSPSAEGLAPGVHRPLRARLPRRGI